MCKTANDILLTQSLAFFQYQKLNLPCKGNNVTLNNFPSEKFGSLLNFRSAQDIYVFTTSLLVYFINYFNYSKRINWKALKNKVSLRKTIYSVYIVHYFKKISMKSFKDRVNMIKTINPIYIYIYIYTVILRHELNQLIQENNKNQHSIKNVKCKSRSSRPDLFYKNDVLKHLTKFRTKQLRLSSPFSE